VTNLFRGFGAVFYKEVLHVRRDAGTLFFSLTMPLLQMFLLGFAIDTNIRQINTVVYNADGRRESRELLDRLKNSDTFHVIRYVENDHDLNDMIIAGKARVGIKIPVEYSDRLLHNMSAQVLVLIDGSDSSVAFFRTGPRSPSICGRSCSSIPIRARRTSFFPGSRPSCC
jgi:ABC-2 type transport system permease protein